MILFSIALNIVLGGIAAFLLLQRDSYETAANLKNRQTQNDAAVKNRFVDNPGLTFLGNSHIACADWNTRLGREDVNICGITDFCSHQLTWVLDWAVISRKPEICFVAGGQEDVFLNVPVSRVIENFGKIAKTLQKNEIKPVLHTVIPFYGYPAYTDSVALINAGLCDWCHANEIDLIDLKPVLCNDRGLKEAYTTDGMHLNEAGYARWAEALQHYLKTME